MDQISSKIDGDAEFSKLLKVITSTPFTHEDLRLWLDNRTAALQKLREHVRRSVDMLNSQKEVAVKNGRS